MREQLQAGIDQLGLVLVEDQVAALLAYLDLLQKWNRVYNLTAVREPGEMLTHHLFDSLAAVAPLRRQTGGASIRLLDVGSGGGLPGVVLAITCPEMEVCCVDTVGKKAAFIQQAAATLKLSNLRGFHARVESLGGAGGGAFDVVCSRAFASLSDFTAWSRGALQPAGVWMAMKGKRPDDEIAALPGDSAVFHVEHLAVPGLDADRCIVWLKPRET
jgi:16S rRNA (guanine527-N7)-methyltransferase